MRAAVAQISSDGRSQTDSALASSDREIQDRPQASVETQWAQWTRHFIEMVIAMMIGMAVLTYPVRLLAGTVNGQRHLHVGGQQISLSADT